MDLFVIGSWRFAGGQANCDVRYSSSCSILIGFIVTVVAPETTEFPVDVVVASAEELFVVADVPASVIVMFGSETQTLSPSAEIRPLLLSNSIRA